MSVSGKDICILYISEQTAFQIVRVHGQQAEYTPFPAVDRVYPLPEYIERGMREK